MGMFVYILACMCINVYVNVYVGSDVLWTTLKLVVSSLFHVSRYCQLFKLFGRFVLGLFHHDILSVRVPSIK